MNTTQKIKKMATIALGFALSTYLIMSGMAMLDEEEKTKHNSEVNVLK